MGISARPDGNAALIDAGADAICHKANFREISAVIERVREVHRGRSEVESM